MEDKQKHTISTVNRIIHILEDGRHGYNNAADHVKDDDLRTMFHLYAQQRAYFAAQLANEIREMGGTPEKRDEWKGKIHRAWMDLKAAVAGNDRDAIFDECERGENAAIEYYEEALKEDIPQYLKDMFKKQFEEIKNNLKQVRKLHGQLQQ